MEYFFLIISGLINVGLLIMGGLKKKRDDTDKLDEKVVKLLNENIAGLDRKIRSLEDSDAQKSKDIAQSVREIAELRASNRIMTDILQGRDEKTQKFQEEGFKAMARLIEVEQFIRNNLPIKQ